VLQLRPWCLPQCVTLLPPARPSSAAPSASASTVVADWPLSLSLSRSLSQTHTHTYTHTLSLSLSFPTDSLPPSPLTTHHPPARRCVASSSHHQPIQPSRSATSRAASHDHVWNAHDAAFDLLACWPTSADGDAHTKQPWLAGLISSYPNYHLCPSPNPVQRDAFWLCRQTGEMETSCWLGIPLLQITLRRV
jgi:hypothetical protein